MPIILGPMAFTVRGRLRTEFWAIVKGRPEKEVSREKTR